MEKKRVLVALIGIGFIFSTSLFLMIQSISSAQVCRLIRIHGDPGGQVSLGLEPETTSIEKGTCVIWVNFSRQEEVQVVFEEGKVCEDVTCAPVGFKLDAKNCYVTNFIPFGGTSSLLFNEEGTFKYTLIAGTEKVQGKLIVRAPK